MMILGYELGYFVNRDYFWNLGKILVIWVAIVSFFGDNVILVNSVGVVIEIISNVCYF